MKTLNQNENCLKQLGMNRVIHAPNLSCEIIDGMEQGNCDLSKMLSSYKMRMQVALNSDDYIILPTECSDIAKETARYHQELNVSSFAPENIVPIDLSGQSSFAAALEENMKTMQSELGMLAKSADTLLPFINSHHVDRVAKRMDLRTYGNAKASNTANNKGIVLEELAALDVPVPRGETVYDEKDAFNCYKKLTKAGAETVFVKLGRAASGQGVFPVSNHSEFKKVMNLPQVIDQLDDVGIRLDYGLNIVSSPNVLVWVGDDHREDRIINSSYQILEKRDANDKFPTVHKGNVGPLQDRDMNKVNPYIRRVCHWLRSKGAYGHAGIDFAIHKDSKGKEHAYVLETNYRINGNSAAAMKAVDLGSKCFGANNGIAVPKNISLNNYVGHLQKEGIEYNGNEGVFVVNPITAEFGKVQIVALAETREKVVDFMNRANIL